MLNHKLLLFLYLVILAQPVSLGQRQFAGQVLQDGSGQAFMEEVPSPYSVPAQPVLPKLPVDPASQGFRFSGNGNLLPFIPSEMDTGAQASGRLEIYNEYYVPRWILPGDPNQNMFVPFDPYRPVPYPYYDPRVQPGPFY